MSGGESIKSTRGWQIPSLPLHLLQLLFLALVIHYFHVMLLAKLESEHAPAVAFENQLPKPQVVKWLAMGNEQLLSDIYWLAFIQYYGDTRSAAKEKFRLCFPYLSLVTQLDPHFVQPYWFTAFSVGSDQKRPDLAAKIIEGGINANQNNWYLPWIAGVNQFLFARSESKAAHYYRLAASYPEAPSWLTKQATIFESKMPALYKELRIWWNVYADSKDPLVKESARQRLIDLYLLEYREAPAESIRNAARDMCHNYLNYDIPRDYPTHPIIK